MDSGASPRQQMWGGHAWRARGARAYNGVFGRSPSGVQGQNPWSGGEGHIYPEAFGAQRKQQIYFILRNLANSLNPNSQPPSSRVKKTQRICINLRNELWQKWGGHVTAGLCRSFTGVGSLNSSIGDERFISRRFKA